MSKINVSVVVNKPIKEVFDYAASPHHGPAFIPNLNENTNIHPEQACVGQKFDWRFNMAGIDLKGNAVVTEYTSPTSVQIVSSGDSNSTWTYNFKEENGATKVTLNIEYDFVESVMQKLANKLVIEKLNQRTMEQSLENLKTILED